MPTIQIKLNKEKIFNGNMKKPGFVLLRGELAPGIEAFKVTHANKLGEATIEIVAKKDKDKE